MKKLITIFAILFLTVPALAKVGLYGNPTPIIISSTRNDPVLIKLYDIDNTVYTEAEVQAITKIEIKYTPSSTADSESTDSVACPDCFNTTTFSEWGEIWVDIANVNFTVGRDREAELIIYTADYTLGYPIATLDIKIDDGAIRDATMIDPITTPIALNDLSDVDTSSSVIGQFLQKTGSATYAFATASGGGSVEDTAYGEGWNGDTTNAPSQNAVYDKIETLAGGHDPVTIGTANGLSLSTQALSLAAATNASAGAATAAHITAIEANTAKVTDDDTGVASVYNDTTWDANTDSPQKNDIRDKINTMDTAIGLNTAKAIDDTAYNATSWDANTDAPSKNAVRDKIESLGAGPVEDDIYGAGWDGDTSNSPSQNAVYDKIDSMDTAIGLNTSKVTNVSTNLSEGTVTETTVDINSSDGSNATLASASTSRAGLLTKEKFDEIVANTAKVTYPGYVFGTGDGDMAEGDHDHSDVYEPAFDYGTGTNEIYAAYIPYKDEYGYTEMNYLEGVANELYAKTETPYTSIPVHRDGAAWIDLVVRIGAQTDNRITGFNIYKAEYSAEYTFGTVYATVTLPDNEFTDASGSLDTKYKYAFKSTDGTNESEKYTEITYIVNSEIDVDILPVGTTSGTIAAGDDDRFTNARTPTAHATTHATGEADAIAPADIGAEPADATIIKAASFTQDSGILVGTGTGTFTEETGATLRTSIGVDPAGTDNSNDNAVNSTYDTGSDGDIDMIDATLWATKQDALPATPLYASDFASVTDAKAVTGNNTGDESAASTTVPGIVELADDTEAAAGTATDKALTPGGGKLLIDAASYSVLSYIPVAEHSGILAGTNNTDLSTYIQAAVTASDYIYFPIGRYCFTDVELDQYDFIVGEDNSYYGSVVANSGTNTPLFKLPSGTSESVTIKNLQVHQQNNVTAVSGNCFVNLIDVSTVVIKDIKTHAYDRGTENAMYDYVKISSDTLQSTFVLIYDSFFINAKNNGITIAGTSSYNIADISLRDLNIMGNANDGINIDYGAGIYMSHVNCYNNGTTGDEDDFGLYMSNSHHIFISNNTLFDSTNGYNAWFEDCHEAQIGDSWFSYTWSDLASSIVIKDSYSFSIDNCQIRSADKHGIELINSHDIDISMGQIFDNSLGAVNTYAEIYIDNDCDKISISNCRLNSSATAYQDYGIQFEDATPTQVKISGCYFDSQTYAIGPTATLPADLVIKNCYSNIDGWIPDREGSLSNTGTWVKTGTISDDTAYSVALGEGVYTILVSSSESSTHVGMGIFESIGTVGANLIFTNSGIFEATTGVLSGTTGTDVKVTLSITAEGVFYIENRRGYGINLDIYIIYKNSP